MKIFIDSADIKEIEESLELNIIDGITTNPSLFAKYSNDFNSTIKNIISIAGNMPLSIEVSAEKYNNMIIEGEKILSFGGNIVLKLPITWDGIKACRFFANQGHKINMTLCFSPLQALIAAKAGAWCISPFVGRLDDIGYEGIELVKDMKLLLNNYSKDYSSQILSASIRHVQHVLASAKAGADICTMPLSIIKQLLSHPLTDKGLKQFISDWEKSGLVI